MDNLVWWLPTFHGDLQLERVTENVTRLRAYELTTAEEEAMVLLRKKALSPGFGRSPWCKESDFLPLTSAAYRQTGGTTVTLQASLEKVHGALSKAMKPGRTLLSVLKMQSGPFEELPEKEGEVAIPEKKKPKARAAVTVAAPRIGCPVPEFPEADVRASRVLEAFLSPDQIADYRLLGAFVTRGADTGHRYMVTNRERPGRMEYVSFRSLYDLDEQRALCVHDWDVPPPEEMLALHLCVSIPGREHLIRRLLDVFGAAP